MSGREPKIPTEFDVSPCKHSCYSNTHNNPNRSHTAANEGERLFPDDLAVRITYKGNVSSDMSHYKCAARSLTAGTGWLHDRLKDVRTLECGTISRDGDFSNTDRTGATLVIDQNWDRKTIGDISMSFFSEVLSNAGLSKKEIEAYSGR
nr:hypothetical protein L204_04455 [Cryptococcus depauperatus CBS 7855]